MLGILYESGEWSDFKLAAELASLDVPVKLFDLEGSVADEDILACDMLFDRVFASACFRGHHRSLARVDALLAQAEQCGIAVVNGSLARAAETSKAHTCHALRKAGIPVPPVYACALPRDLQPAMLSYPCVIKPDCGGRTTFTAIAHDVQECNAFLAEAPEATFVAQRYIEPRRGYVTRIEVVNGLCELVVARSVAEGGLSAYHLGSRYRVLERLGAPQASQAEQASQASQAARLAERCAQALGIAFGSFDIIENDEGSFVIDANAVSNVSPDCTETFGMDLMARYASALAQQHETLCARECAGKPPGS